ncbi:hypothetical protein T03_15152 [Trichinella britovi]|uniref:Uncharacterized protein n=1 Tax=Trichinella britovi TaxID=45882 RepID=A0A0V1CZE1_TRIBR|nr:hypothetical protein T03_15152 [Trichinella britovi]
MLHLPKVGRPAVKGGSQCGERSSAVCIGVDIRRAPPGLLNRLTVRQMASEVSITNRTLPVVVIRAPEIETPIVEGSVGGVRCDMLVDTGSAVTLANERFIRHLKTLRDVPKPSIRLETATGRMRAGFRWAFAQALLEGIP